MSRMSASLSGGTCSTCSRQDANRLVSARQASQQRQKSDEWEVQRGKSAPLRHIRPANTTGKERELSASAGRSSDIVPRCTASRPACSPTRVQQCGLDSLALETTFLASVLGGYRKARQFNAQISALTARLDSQLELLWGRDGAPQATSFRLCSVGPLSGTSFGH